MSVIAGKGEYEAMHGDKVIVFDVENGEAFGKFLHPNGFWQAAKWLASNGEICGGVHRDFCVKGQRKTVYVNIYPRVNGFAIHQAHSTREAADRNSDHSRVACVPVTFMPGEGLES